MATLPLSVQLSRAIAALTPDVSIVVWSNVLQYVADRGAEVRDMPRRSCLSKRALQTAYTRLDRMGLAFVERSDGRGEKLLRLTDAGLAARASWAPVDPAFDEVAPLRGSLVAVVEALECEQAHYPTQYGTADCSITGGPGQDWKPVPRGDDPEHRTPVAELSLLALLSQCFLALAIDYEASNGALAQTANVLSWLPDDGARLSSLPADARALLSGLERHGQVKATSGNGPIVPTWVGGRRRDAHEATLARVEHAWRERHGGDVITGLSAALDEFVPAAAASASSDVSGVFHAPTYALFGYQPLR